MKKTIAIIIIAATLTSCGGKKSINEVKLIPVKSGKEFQYIDQEGKIVINPQFSEATIFREGLALVKTSGENQKYGYISEDGKFVIPANYKKATVFSNGLAWVVSDNGAPTAINEKGEIKFTLTDAQKVNLFQEDLAAYSVSDTSTSKSAISSQSDGLLDGLDEELTATLAAALEEAQNGINNIIGGKEKWGFVDKEGKVKINPQFKSVGFFSNGICAIKNNEGKWGYIDKEGKIVINPQFDFAKEFINGVAIVEAGGKSGVINKEGKYIINPQFSNITIDGDLFLISQDGKKGWCDDKGKIIINPQFESAFPFGGNKLASIKTDKTFGFIDKEGKIVINPQFDYALPFNGKLALVSSGNKIGFIDDEGKYAINPQFDDVSADLVRYLENGSSSRESVTTDYFNMNAITDRAKKIVSELNFTTTFNELIKKYNLKEAELSKYSTSTKLVNNEAMSSDANFDLHALGNPWQMDTDTYQYVVNKSYVPEGYQMEIDLKGNGNGKEEEVFKALQSIFTGYKKDDTNSNEKNIEYMSDKQKITLFKNNGINIKVQPLDNNVAQ